MTDQYVFEKLNDEPIPIECVEDEHEERRDFQPSFWWFNRRYYLDSFVRCHNNPWMPTGVEFPEHIHGVEADSYCSPLFIELIGDSAVNVYKEKRRDA